MSTKHISFRVKPIDHKWIQSNSKKFNTTQTEILSNLIGSARGKEAELFKDKVIQKGTKYGKGGSITKADFTAVMTKRLIITGSTLRPRTKEEKAKIIKNFHKSYWTALTKKTIKPIIYKIFNLKDAFKAHKLMESSKHLGKIVLKIK